MPRVLIVGSGPVGLTLAMDLAWRGIDVVVAERRPRRYPPNVKCGQIGARSMEIFRRLGVADKLRGIGLPGTIPTTSSRRPALPASSSSGLIPASGVGTPTAAGPDTGWPTPEHTHRCNQMFFEPVLFAHAAEQPRIRILHRTEITELAQGKQGVTASAVDLDAGTRSSIECDYLVGCDGASSLCASRSAPSSSASQCCSTRNRSTSGPRNSGVCCLASLPGPLLVNPRRCGMTMAVDGRETWNIQNYSYPGEAGLDHLDRDWVIRSIFGVGPDFDYELLSREDWDRSPACREQVSRPARVHLRRRRACLDAARGLRHECRHRGRGQPRVEARGVCTAGNARDSDG